MFFLAALNGASAEHREDPAERYYRDFATACGFGSALPYLEYLTKIFVPKPRRVQHEAKFFVIFFENFRFFPNISKMNWDVSEMLQIVE